MSTASFQKRLAVFRPADVGGHLEDRFDTVNPDLHQIRTDDVLARPALRGRKTFHLHPSARSLLERTGSRREPIRRGAAIY
jgi:hypothetical protein